MHARILVGGLLFCGAWLGGCVASGTSVGVYGGSGGIIVGQSSGGVVAVESDPFVGTGVGGAAGEYIGRYMDRHAEALRAALAKGKVERVGEGVRVRIPSDDLFPDQLEWNLSDDGREELDRLAPVLEKFDETDVLVAGHTDTEGWTEDNLKLSIRRAESVAEYLGGLHVLPTRLVVSGYGQAVPVATNETREGRAANRRIELAITASDALKQKAEKESG